jgi:hypothetical protein
MSLYRYTAIHTAGALALLLASVSGCAESIAPAAASVPVPARFEADAAGSIEGRVCWSGDLPAVEQFPYHPGASHGENGAPLRRNPFAPAIDPHSHGLRDAVVYLRGVDVQQARTWDHPRVLVEQRDRQLHVVQGERDARIGFVRRGDKVDMVAREPRFHALRARGASHFTLAFPDPDAPIARVLDTPGVIELSSGAGYYWMRAFLWVCEHPYYALTDADGRFTLLQVPPGSYDLMCWLPDWRETGHDRDPDTGLVTRLRFGPPAAITQSVQVRARQTCTIRLEIGMSAFPQ